MHSLAKLGLVLLAITIFAPRLGAIPSEELDGVSFAEDPHMLFVPVEEIALALGWEMHSYRESGSMSLNGHLLDAAHLRKLTNGTLFSWTCTLHGIGALR